MNCAALWVLACVWLSLAGVSTAAAQVGDNPDNPGDSDDHQELRDRIAELERRLADTQALVLQRRTGVTVGGYVDFGFFVPQGDGTGFVQDVGPLSSRHFPEYGGNTAWVFLGDLLAPAVNTRGEPADLGNTPGIDRLDSIQSRGAPGFVINELNMSLNAVLGNTALLSASVDFLPRSGVDFRLGDMFEVDLAQVEWILGASRRTSIFAGKIEPVLGIEYRERKASQRFGITPSLVARYTTGTPLGLKVRTKLGAGDWLVLAGALTNGSSTTETFHFYDELDSNAGKTLSGRVSVSTGRRLEIGVSGEYGPQDHALDSAHPLWFFGVDMQAHLGALELKGQWLTGRGDGERGRSYEPPHRTYGLVLRAGGYLEANLMVTPWLGLLGRAELRDAGVWLGDPSVAGGADRLYITKGWRLTQGIRIVPSEHVILKAEYLHNGEYDRVPRIRNDVFTSSLVLIY